MMFITTHLQTYSPKNRACQELCDFIKNFEHIVIADECSLDAMVEEITLQIANIKARYPKIKPIYLSRTNSRIEAIISSQGSPDYVFFLDYHKVKSTYRFSELPNNRRKEVLNENCD